MAEVTDRLPSFIASDDGMAAGATTKCVNAKPQ
jgi:hypothetical protein